MKYMDMLDLKLYHLQLFIYTVECSNITKAANMAHVSQSMLSKTINGMENSLGLQLFIRKNNGMIVTPAGRILYEEAVKIRRSMEIALEKAHVAQEARQIPIRIAYLNTVDPNKFLNQTIENFILFRPDLQCRIEKGSFADIKEMMLHGEVDILFTAFFEEDSFEKELFFTEKIIQCNMEAYMLTTNPLSKKEKISFVNLKSQNFIAIAPSESPNYMKSIQRLSGLAGFIPRIAYFAKNSESIPENVVKNDDIFIADRYFNMIDKDKFVSRPIENTKSGILLVCRKECDSKVYDFYEKTVIYWRKTLL